MTLSRRAVAALAAALPFLALPVPADAGGGPETVLVVVNADSPASLEVANEYVRLRDVPASHVLYLTGVPAAPVVPVESFREAILRPIEAYLAAEGLADDVDTVAYSVGFPYGVDFSADVKEAKFEPPQIVSPTASLTAMTYLYRHVLAKDPAGYLSLQANGYFRKDARMGSGSPGGRAPTPEEQSLAEDARAAMQTKDWARAAAALEKLLATFPDEPESWYNLACCRSLLGKAEAALDALEKAVAHGFSQAEHALSDPDLEGIRGLPGFQKVLEAMRAGTGGDLQTSRAFTPRRAWKGGDLSEEDPDGTSRARYRLAVMLGWTGANGMGVPEAVGVLRRAIPADGTRPDGTVYLMASKDQARAGPRIPFFETTAQMLRRLGRKAEILKADEDGQDGVLPRGKSDMLGIVAGVAGFTWAKDLPDLLPGAIAEHLTSFGAHFGTSSQTKCTEFLRHGAAGTSGAVAEPFNPWVKHPVPYLHVHYARGCSLAEAFYQSLCMPYQTLVLGDPLCRPFAFLAEVGLEGADPAAPWKGTVEVRARVDAAPGHGPERVELWVDGRRAAEGAPDAALPWDTATVPDGVHDVRLVAIETGPVATRSSRRFEVSVANGSDSVTVARAPETVTWGDPVRLEGKATGPGAVEVVRGREVLATAEVSGGTWKAEIPSPRLGPGPVALGVRGTRDGKVAALAAPVRLAVVSPTKRTLPRAVVEADLLPGLRAVVTDTSGAEKEGTVVGLSGGEGRNFGHDLNAMGAAGAKKARLEGYLRVAQAGDWDLEVRVPARIRLALGGREVIALAEPPPGGRATARVALEPGFHDVVLEVEGADVSRLALLLGGPQAAGPVAGRDLFHAATGRVRADAPEAAVHSGTTPAPEAIDGNREGKAVDLPPEGLEVHWKKTARNLESVVLIPRRGRDDARVPSDWIVETRAGTTGKWKPVTGLRTVLTPSFEAPTKDGERDPTAIEISFEKVSVRQLRVRPAAAAPPVRLLEVLVFAKGK